MANNLNMSYKPFKLYFDRNGGFDSGCVCADSWAEGEGF